MEVKLLFHSLTFGFFNYVLSETFFKEVSTSYNDVYRRLINVYLLHYDTRLKSGITGPEEVVHC
jgi:hypothetical protein